MNATTEHSAPRHPYLGAGLGAVLLILALHGCGSLTAGGLVGETTVTVSGDAPDSVGAPAAASLVGPPALQDDDGEDEAEGEIEVDFRLFLVPDGGAPVELSDDEIEVRVDLRGRQEVDAVRRAVPAQRYTALRIDFTAIEVEVDRGLVVDGRVVTGAVDVEFDDGVISIERPLRLDLSDGEAVELLVDLNTQSWLRAVDPDLRRVAQQIFAQAITVRVR